ncbi:MAG: class I SAM-dependent methyltransferase [Gammaproteobacteria bacterium]|nr:class I SAM-dependent methyltransferase [Gammaproteobacteria bacterium]
MTNRKDHWEGIYSDKSPLEVSWYQKEPTLSLQLIEHCQLDKDQPIIDVGGGASVLIDHLLSRGYTQTAVLDISDNALTVARQRLADKANTVEWYVSDVTEFSAPHPFALWHDRAVFHFLTEASDRRKYIEALKAGLSPGGFLILAAFAIGGPTMCSGLNIVQYDAEKISQELGIDFELIEQMGETHLTPSGGEQLFSYFRFKYKPTP